MKRLHFYLGLAVFVGILLSISHLAGCKDEDGTVTFNVCQHKDIKESMDFMWKCGDCGRYIDKEERESWTEPIEPKLTYTIEELHEIYKDEPALLKLAKALYGFGEPNEPIFTKTLPTVNTDIYLEPNKPNEPSFQELLIKPPADWTEKYGDSLESQQTANIVLTVQVVNNQGKAIKELDERLKAIEIPKEAVAIIDPNGAK